MLTEPHPSQMMFLWISTNCGDATFCDTISSRHPLMAFMTVCCKAQGSVLCRSCSATPQVEDDCANFTKRNRHQHSHEYEYMNIFFIINMYTNVYIYIYITKTYQTFTQPGRASDTLPEHYAQKNSLGSPRSRHWLPSEVVWLMRSTHR